MLRELSKIDKNGKVDQNESYERIELKKGFLIRVLRVTLSNGKGRTQALRAP
jgi:hypothetical protein